MLSIPLLAVIIGFFAICVWPQMSPAPVSPSPTVTVQASSDVDADNYIDDNELTAGQKSEAINIALNDTIVRQILSGSGLSYSLGKVTPSTSNDISGYIGAVLPLVSVPVTIKGGSTGETTDMTINNITHPIGRWSFDKSLMVYIDMNRHRVASVAGHEVGEKYNSANGTATSIPQPMIPPGSYYHYDPMNRCVIIPSGSGWYHVLDDWRPNYQISVSLEPEDAMVYPILLNETNFEKYRNGSAYEALACMDRSTNETRLLDGNTAIRSGWSGDIAMKIENEYIVFKNAGQSEVRVNVTF